MRATVVRLCVAATVLAGCGKPAAPADACIAPTFAPPADPASYAGQRELAHACMKTAAYSIARQGGSVAAVAEAVLARCGVKEADEIAALRKTGPVYGYQIAEIHETLVHLAKISAVQARARGCGLPAGETTDTMLESKP